MGCGNPYHFYSYSYSYSSSSHPCFRCRNTFENVSHHIVLYCILCHIKLNYIVSYRILFLLSSSFSSTFSFSFSFSSYFSVRFNRVAAWKCWCTMDQVIPFRTTVKPNNFISDILSFIALHPCNVMSLPYLLFLISVFVWELSVIINASQLRNDNAVDEMHSTNIRSVIKYKSPSISLYRSPRVDASVGRKSRCCHVIR